MYSIYPINIPLYLPAFDGKVSHYIPTRNPSLFPRFPISRLWHSSMKSRSESRPELFLALSMAWKASSAVPNSAVINDLGGAGYWRWRWYAKILENEDATNIYILYIRIRYTNIFVSWSISSDFYWENIWRKSKDELAELGAQRQPVLDKLVKQFQQEWFVEVHLLVKPVKLIDWKQRLGLKPWVVHGCTKNLKTFTIFRRSKRCNPWHNLCSRI